MTKQRQDAWSEENDLLLAETVLRHVREGSTQLNAFEEVGDKLNRTSAACGFRWNAVVRHQYEKALQLAKKQRKQRMRALGNGQPAKKRLLYQPPAVDPEIIQETAAEEPVKTETPSVENEQPLMSGEHMPFVDES
ncbi:RsfA family transcriptional regulator, partial [Sphingomonas koreensis]